MLGECVEVGDKVVVAVLKENREWGYNPAPDGAVGTITSFGTTYWGRTNNCGHKPGKYVNRSWVSLKLEDGTEVPSIGCSHLEPFDKQRYKQREKERRERYAKSHDDAWREEKEREEWLAPLPQTALWEGDKVRYKPNFSRWEGEEGVIFSIDYMDIHSDNANLRNSLYRVALNKGGTTSPRNNEIELIERGNVWKYYHNEPLVFADLREEANFYDSIGRVEELRNPANGLYSWTKDEVLDAIAAGKAHSLSLSAGFFGTQPKDQAKWFEDEEVGRRIAIFTLRGFNRDEEAKALEKKWGNE